MTTLGSESNQLSTFHKLRYSLGGVKKKLCEKIDDHSWNQSSDSAIKQSQKLLQKLQGSHTGRCFVVGNGPSINKMNLDLMKNDVVIVSNSFFLKFPDMSFRPQYFTVEDHLVAEDNKNEIEKLPNIIKFYPYDLRNTLSLDQQSAYVNMHRAYTNQATSKFPFFSFDVPNKIYWGGTVLFMSLQIAAFLGFDKIYMIGVDLTYKIPKETERKGSVLTSTVDDPNHFDPSYFGKGKRWHLPETDRMQQAFSKAYHELKAQNISLYNATEGGNLKEIPRQNYSDLF